MFFLWGTFHNTFIPVVGFRFCSSAHIIMRLVLEALLLPLASDNFSLLLVDQSVVVSPF